jgi:hypothetical protein
MGSLEPYFRKEFCTLLTPIKLVEDCEISDGDGIEDKAKPSLECMKGFGDAGFIGEEEHRDRGCYDAWRGKIHVHRIPFNPRGKFILFGYPIRIKTIQYAQPNSRLS